MTSTAERQRAFRERQKAKGLVPVTVYVRREDAGKVKEFAAKLWQDFVQKVTEELIAELTQG